MRLKGYDYGSAGAYFITICAHNQERLFGEIIRGKMKLNQFGEIVHNEWERSQHIREEIELDQFVVMPNHIHGIVIIIGANSRSPGFYNDHISMHDDDRLSTHGCGNRTNKNWSNHNRANSRSPLRYDHSSRHNITRASMHDDNRSPLHNNTRSSAYNGDRPHTRMKSKTISSFVAGYKSTVTKQINIMRNTPRSPVWQRNYYEHIIRGEEDLIRIREYIVNNPSNWE